METTPQVSNDESINQMQYTQSNFETSSTENYKDVNCATTYNHFEGTSNIPAASSAEYSNELIINEDALDQSQNVQNEYPVAPQSMEVSKRLTSDQSNTNYHEEISQDSSVNVEYSAISSQKNTEPVINSKENEKSTVEVKAIILTNDNVDSSFSSETVENISDPDDSIIEANVEISDELKNERRGGLIINECDQHMEDEDIPSFIGEVDESVSLPPAEPLILEHEEIPQHNIVEVVQDNLVEQPNEENVAEQPIKENVVEQPVQENTTEQPDQENTTEQLIQENDVEHVVQEDVIEHVVQENVVEQLVQENVVEVIQGTVEEIVTEKIVENEIEVTEAPHAEIISEGETHIQYTVLPPGENSVYQEDGTLVVEYPLNNTTPLDANATHNSESIMETSPDKIELANVEVKQEKPQSKPKGRRPAGHIPLHILGHNIDKPVQDVPNGKPILKPRLGVKIPYRNLASQIVSTTELRQQIVERARQKQEAQTHVDSTNMFAKKLTHRLAQSLSGKGKIDTNKKETIIETKSKVVTAKSVDKLKKTEENWITSKLGENTSDSRVSNPIEIVEAIKSEDMESLQTLQENINSSSKSKINETAESILEVSDSLSKFSEVLPDISEAQRPSLNIESNSDLIAILEGDGDEVSPIIIVSKPLENQLFDNNSSEINEIEKEISSTEQKVIQVTPLVKEKKFFKSRDSRLPESVIDKIHTGKDKEAKITPAPNSEKKIISESKSSLSAIGDIKVQSNSKIQDSKGPSSSKSPLKSTDEKKMSKDTDKTISDQKDKKYTGPVVEVEPRLKPAMVLKTYTRKRKSNDVSTPEPSKKPLIETPTPSMQPDPKIDFVSPVPPNVYITKSSRVIKKKVIWDPDEAMPSIRNQSKILSKIETTTKGTPSPKVPVLLVKPSISKAATEKKSIQDRQIETPKSTKPTEKKAIKSVIEEKEKKTPSTDKQFMKKPEKTEIPKRIRSPAVVKSLVVIKSTTVVKSPSVSKTPVPSEEEEAKSSPGKSPKRSTKRLSEIDRLLMDEGAVNMLYDINNSEDQKRRVSTRTAITANDKAQIQKDLLDRTQEIKNELTQGTSAETAPKVLRKKEVPSATKKETKDVPGPPAVRKMSKDSSKSSIHSPPPSPAAFTQADASRIIRRHSSSSFSSNDELVQETLADADEKEKERQTKKKPQPSQPSNIKTPTVASSPEKNAKERPAKKKLPLTPEVPPKKKIKRERPVETEEEEPQKPVEITMKCEPGVITGELKTDPSKTFTLIKMNKHYMINLTYSGGENYLTVQLLKDLTVTLKELVKNKNCNVVSIHSQGPAFCLGLDYKGLVESDEELRKKRAIELSSCVRDFLKCLLHFPKVIVAGIKGDCVGFGVTMLPLFDMIVASDTASFCTPYGKLGCAPEAGFLLSIPFQSNHGLASELLYTSQRMNADEAQRRGLVTKLFWPEKFDTEFRGLLLHISNLSKLGLMRTKKELRMLYSHSTEAALNSSCKMLVNFWRTEECQKNFSKYNALTFDIDQ